MQRSLINISTGAIVVLVVCGGCASSRVRSEPSHRAEGHRTETKNHAPTHERDALPSENPSATLVLALRGQLRSATERAKQSELALVSMANTNDRLSKQVGSLERRLSREEKNGRELTAALDECRTAATVLVQQQARGKVYAGVGAGHWVWEKIGSGEYVLLEDGSLWEISSIDRIYSMLWLTTEDTMVLENPSGFLPYLLINTDAGDRVEAKYVGTE